MMLGLGLGMNFGGGKLFAPSDVANLGLWCRSDLGITLNGSTVSAWADQSGNSRNLLQTTAINQPTYVTGVQNGQAVVRFDGVNDSLRATGFSFVQPETVFAVLRLNTSTGGDVLYDGGTAYLSMAMYDTAGSFRSVLYAGSYDVGLDRVFGTSFVTTAGVFNGASSKHRLNGSQTTGNVGTGAASLGLTLGARGTATPAAFSNIDVLEIAIYERELTTAELQQLEAYAQARYAHY